MLTGKHMNQQAEIHIFINYSNPDKIRTDLKFNSAKVAGYLRYYKCKANSEGISKMTSNERQKKIIRLLDKRRERYDRASFNRIPCFNRYYQQGHSNIKRGLSNKNSPGPKWRPFPTRRIPLVQENVHDSCSGTRIT